MFKYIVTWIIVLRTAGACPESVPGYDEYGRIIPVPQYLTSEACFFYDTTSKEKYFDIKKDAIDFINRGQDKKVAGINPLAFGELSNFKLDSIPLMQFNCSHQLVSTTLMACGNHPCNTCTCMNCGKRWSCY